MPLWFWNHAFALKNMLMTDGSSGCTHGHNTYTTRCCCLMSTGCGAAEGSASREGNRRRARGGELRAPRLHLGPQRAPAYLPGGPEGPGIARNASPIERLCLIVGNARRFRLHLITKNLMTRPYHYRSIDQSTRLYHEGMMSIPTSSSLSPSLSSSSSSCLYIVIIIGISIIIIIIEVHHRSPAAAATSAILYGQGSIVTVQSVS